MGRTIQPAETRRLHLLLEAMRNLPPGTRLPQPPSLLEQGVLADMLAVPDEADPLRWLRAERAAAATLTLRLLLEQARDACRSAQRRPAAWPPLPPEYQAILGDLLGQTIGTGDPWHDLPPDPATAVDPDRLRTVLREVRQARGQPIASTSAREDWLQLLAALLDLPDQVDPVAWLAEEEGPMSVHLALSHLLDTCLPPRDALWPDSPARLNLRPMARLRSSRGLRVVIKQVLFTETGGALRLEARLLIRSWSRSPEMVGIFISWRGFDRVVDDRGYHYLVWATEGHGGTHLLGWKQEITLAVYPGIAPEATALTFIAQPIVIEAHSYDRATGRELALPAREGGDLVWRLPLRHAARHSA